MNGKTGAWLVVILSLVGLALLLQSEQIMLAIELPVLLGMLALFFGISVLKARNAVLLTNIFFLAGIANSLLVYVLMERGLLVYVVAAINIFGLVLSFGKEEAKQVPKKVAKARKAEKAAEPAPSSKRKAKKGPSRKKSMRGK